jgi:F0F1-type ATP synthase epsilon subunit
MVDVARAERARQRALERLDTGGGEMAVDIARARRALMRAENRLRLAGRTTNLRQTVP